jgi:hypothetical protein
VLFYSSEIWHSPDLKRNLKHLLFAASSNACLKICLNYPSSDIYYNQLHVLTNRATPEMYSYYKLALLLYRVMNHNIPLHKWVNLNFKQVLTSRQSTFQCDKTNKLWVWLNAISNRFHYLNNKLPLDWFNQSIGSFKINCKKLSLSF